MSCERMRSCIEGWPHEIFTLGEARKAGLTNGLSEHVRRRRMG
jgi:hypothetical protein